MIFLARLGGGGSSSLFFAPPESARFRCTTGEGGGERFMAAGGRINELSMLVAFSCFNNPVEEAGVSRSLTRGIVSSEHWQEQGQET